VSWRIAVSTRAREILDTWDAGFREEVIDRAYELSDNPAERLVRNTRGVTGNEAWDFEYTSALDDRVKVVLTFVDIDFAHRALTLFGLARYTMPDEETPGK
jgi:hypothetical protein